MANKTFYIPARDEGLWEAVDRVADLHDTSAYQILREALDKHLPIMAARPRPTDRWAGIAAEPDTTTLPSPNP